MDMKRAWLFAFLLNGCVSSRPAVSRVPTLTIAGTDGRAHPLWADVSESALTVYVFFSAHCRCLAVHEPRLRALEESYAPRGVRFFFVDSEAGATVARDRVQAHARNYTFPILVDPGAAFADAMGAEYATYTVVVDRSGSIRYDGGIDSDRSHLRAGAQLFLRDALDDLLAGRAPRVAHGEALGCALEKG
jgi:redoxin